MSKPKVRFMNPPADTLYFYFNTQEALQEWVDGLKHTDASALVSLPSDETAGVSFYMIHSRIFGLIVGETPK
jgi:hypothetical protein